jgi:hypothetical protein
MPDLSADAVAVWLSENGPAIASNLTSRPEYQAREEHDVVLPAVLQLGQVMDDALARAPDALRERLRDRAVLISIRTALAQFGQARRLRLLTWLAALPDSTGLFNDILGSDESEAAQFLRAEIRNLHRRQLLDRMFSPERIAALLAACAAAQ